MLKYLYFSVLFVALRKHFSGLKFGIILEPAAKIELDSEIQETSVLMSWTEHNLSGRYLLLNYAQQLRQDVTANKQTGDLLFKHVVVTAIG